MMLKRAGLFVCLALAVAGSAHAREVEGVQMPERAVVAQHELILNGAGIRTKLWIKVYVGALYLETPTRDAKTAIGADQPKRITLVLLRDLSKHQQASALREGFEANAGPERMRYLAGRMQKFEDFMRDGKRGDWMMLTYEPGKGTVATDSAGHVTIIPGKDFADAVFAIWLGPHPADDGLKKAMLSPSAGAS
jgi:chalcone isomerase-like protein